MSCATLALPPSDRGRISAQWVTYARRILPARDRRAAWFIIKPIDEEMNEQIIGRGKFG